MHRSEWRSCSHESEVAHVWRNATSSEPKLWPPGEPIDDGRRARCSLAHCHRLALESDDSQVQLHGPVARRSMNVRAEEVGWASLQGEMACPLTKNRLEMGLQRADRFIHYVPWEHPSFMKCSYFVSLRILRMDVLSSQYNKEDFL
jgi:hypothetical protein